MSDLAGRFIREPYSEDPKAFARRVRSLAAIYTVLFFSSLGGEIVLLARTRLFMSLAQRSNVETLTLLFFLVFFGYMAFVSGPGAAGAARIFLYWLRARSGSGLIVERAKAEALGPPRGEEPEVALNVVLEREGAPGEPFTLEIADPAGPMGKLLCDGARLKHLEARRDGSYNLFPYFTHQLMEVHRARGVESDVDVVEWKKIEDDQMRRYLGMVRFAENLRRHLGSPSLWPCVQLTAADCQVLTERLSAICGPMRSEGFLPHWEYSAEHKLPVIPEPLGLVTLSRDEKRADPIATMGCATMVVLFAAALLLLFALAPPWVPGS